MEEENATSDSVQEPTNALQSSDSMGKSITNITSWNHPEGSKDSSIIVNTLQKPSLLTQLAVDVNCLDVEPALSELTYVTELTESASTLHTSPASQQLDW